MSVSKGNSLFEALSEKLNRNQVLIMNSSSLGDMSQYEQADCE